MRDSSYFITNEGIFSKSKSRYHQSKHSWFPKTKGHYGKLNVFTLKMKVGITLTIEVELCVALQERS